MLVAALQVTAAACLPCPCGWAVVVSDRDSQLSEGSQLPIKDADQECPICDVKAGVRKICRIHSEGPSVDPSATLAAWPNSRVGDTFVIEAVTLDDGALQRPDTRKGTVLVE
jgi:hypothetical protein